MKKIILAIPTGIFSLIATAAIVYLSLSTDSVVVNEMGLFPGFDKIAHFISYFGCAAIYLLDYAKFKIPHHTKLNIELVLTTTAILLGLFMEIAQLVLANGRSYELLDWVSDIAGAVFAFLFMHYYFLHIFRKKFYRTAVHNHRHRH